MCWTSLYANIRISFCPLSFISDKLASNNTTTKIRDVKLNTLRDGYGNGVYRHFQQYFSYIVAALREEAVLKGIYINSIFEILNVSRSPIN